MSITLNGLLELRERASFITNTTEDNIEITTDQNKD